jgi:phosphoribosylglycinamide formyltransferase-1
MIIGIFASGSGGSLDVALNIIKLIHPNACFIGFSDRDCDAFQVLDKYCLNVHQYLSQDRELISKEAASFFQFHGCGMTILSYSRLVTSSLYDSVPCFNIHPSLLPDYKGFGAIQQAFDGRAVQIGATIHKVDSTVDGGKIICQAMTVPTLIKIEYWHSLMYLMKSLLLSSFIDSKVDPDGNRPLAGLCCAPFLPEFLQLKGISTSVRIQLGILAAATTSNAASLLST